MNPLQAALREKFGTPERALEALGLPATLLASDQSATDAPRDNASRRSTKMAKLSATAQRVHAALTAHLVPLLAQDAQLPDLVPVVRGLTKSNLGKQKAKVWADTKVLIKPVLASDAASPDDVAMRILDMIDKTAPAEAEAEMAADPGAAVTPEASTAVTEPNAGVPAMKPGEEEEAEDMDEEEAAKLMKLKELLGDEDLAQKCYDACMGAKDEVVNPGATEIPATTEPAKEAEDEEEVPMLKPAMDAAIKLATEQVKADMRAEARAAQEARAFVQPLVGQVSLSFDTAQDIYKATLKALGVETKGLHPSAYRALLERMPRSSRREMAQDSAPRGKDRSTGRAAELVGRISIMG